MPFLRSVQTSAAAVSSDFIPVRLWSTQDSTAPFDIEHQWHNCRNPSSFNWHTVEYFFPEHPAATPLLLLLLLFVFVFIICTNYCFKFSKKRKHWKQCPVPVGFRIFYILKFKQLPVKTANQQIEVIISFRPLVFVSHYVIKSCSKPAMNDFFCHLGAAETTGLSVY